MRRPFRSQVIDSDIAKIDIESENIFFEPFAALIVTIVAVFATSDKQTKHQKHQQTTKLPRVDPLAVSLIAP